MAEALREPFTIGQLAQVTGVSAQAIRYYERIGLAPRPQRGGNGYRHYTRADVNRMLLLHRVRQMETPLALAKPLVDHAAQARCAEVRQDLLALAAERLTDIDHEIARLRALRAEVARFQRGLAAVCVGAEISFTECDDTACVIQPDHCTHKEIPMLPISNNTACCDCDCPDCPDCSTCCGDKGCCGLTA